LSVSNLQQAQINEISPNKKNKIKQCETCSNHSNHEYTQSAYQFHAVVVHDYDLQVNQNTHAVSIV